MIVDAHVHVFPRVHGYGPKGETRSAGYGGIDFGDGKPSYVLPVFCEKTSHTVEMLLHNMDRCGVDKAVILLCPCYGDWSDYVQDACLMYPEKLTGSAFFDPWKPDAKEYYRLELQGPAWKNIKIEFSETGGLCGVYPGAELDAPELRWIWKAMEDEGKTVSFDLGRPGDRSYQTGQIRSIAQRHPGLKIVICHMGQPSRKAEQDPELWNLWLEQIRLGQLSNVWFDLSALPYHVRKEEEYPFPSTRRYFNLVLSITGAEKLLWGSDIPWLLGTATYAQLVRHGQRLVEKLSADEQERILSGNAETVYWNH